MQHIFTTILYLIQIRELRLTEDEDLEDERNILGRFITEKKEARGTLEDAARHLYCPDGELYSSIQ